MGLLLLIRSFTNFFLSALPLVTAGLIRRSQVTGRRAQVTGRRSQVTGRRSQVPQFYNKIYFSRMQPFSSNKQVLFKFSIASESLTSTGDLNYTIDADGHVIAN